jgi:MHS family proline/betaine transporter-like MFS transporter
VIVTWLGGIALIGDLAPGYYLTVICMLSLSALIVIRRTSANA